MEDGLGSFSNTSRNHFQGRAPSLSGHSPSVPARSPYRIRDSQASVRMSEKPQERIISHHAIEEPVSRLRHLSAADRSSLSAELSRLWRYKPDLAPKPPAIRSKVDGTDDLLLQLLVSQACLDARDFEILSFEHLDTLKQEHHKAVDRLSTAASRLELETKIKHAARSLAYLDNVKAKDGQPEMSSELEEQVRRLTEEEAALQRKILFHTAGVLNAGIQRLETKDENPRLPPQPAEAAPETEDQRNGQEMARTLDMLLRQYQTKSVDVDADVDADAPTDSDSDTSTKEPARGQMPVLRRLGDCLEAFRLRTRELERRLERAESQQEIKDMSEKKLEIQLRAMQDRKEAAEARCRTLEETSSRQDPALASLREQLAHVLHENTRLQNSLDDSQAEARSLKAAMIELEVKASKATAQTDHQSQAEAHWKVELDQCQDELAVLRSEKESWERTMKRSSVLQLMEGGSDSLRAKYEQQLEEQAEEYEAQLKEQGALLDKTTRTLVQTEGERDKKTAIIGDIEELLREKIRNMDSRDNKISRLEAEMRALRTEQAQQAPGAATEAALREAQREFAKREAAWMDQGTSMEANFEGILKEYDRLTGSAMEFEADRMKYQRRIDDLTRHISQLESVLAEEQIRKLGHSGPDPPTTANLRKEFRQMVNDMKADHQRSLEQGLEEKRVLETQVKNLKHEREMALYERVNKGVQTFFTLD
ncbi:hypothetical protein CLU79DRAFT_499002 [Phycomyces nitens]|nr:hypothetical protein CLU79DRAFT_499002 [Phycomyces nitens]